MKIKHVFSAFAISTAVFFSGLVSAVDEVYVDKKGVTLSGYDTVAYFTENAAVKGSDKYSTTYYGATYYFSSEANKGLFEADPSKYAPQYGGYCAYGAALGKKFDVDGEAFEVIDGKLYVNKNKKVYKLWSKEKSENIETANEEWPEIKAVAVKDL